MKHVTLLRAVLLAVALYGSAAHAQYDRRNMERQKPEHSFYYSFGMPVYAEVVNLMADDPSLSRVLANFRISYDAISFHKPAYAAESAQTFTAIVTVRGSLIDEHDVTAQRAQWTDTITAHSYMETIDKHSFVTGSLMFDVPPGKYTLDWVVENAATHELIREQKPTITAENFERLPVAVSKPVVAALVSADELIPRTLGGNVEFNLPAMFYAELIAPDTPRVTYELLHYDNTNGGGALRDSTTVEKGTADVHGGKRLALHNNRCCTMNGFTFEDDSLAKRALQNMMCDTVAQNMTAYGGGVPALGKRYYCAITLTGDSLELGDYKLVVHALSGADTARMAYPFKVIWSNMPLSMTDLDYAIDAMRYILTDEQTDSMKSGDKAERRKMFEAYWKAHDPTPGTVYNEREAEYYRRVDYAFFNFRDPVKPDDDGMRTDRGKIYILYGKPTGVDRRLLPDGPAQETWTYKNNVSKQFIFLDDEKDGNYKLSQIIDLK